MAAYSGPMRVAALASTACLYLLFLYYLTPSDNSFSKLDNMTATSNLFSSTAIGPLTVSSDYSTAEPSNTTRIATSSATDRSQISLGSGAALWAPELTNRTRPIGGFWHISLVFPELFVKLPFDEQGELTPQGRRAIDATDDLSIDIHSLPWRSIVKDQYNTMVTSGILVSG